MKISVSLLLAIVALFCLIGWSGYGQRQSSSKMVWEYKILYLNDGQDNVRTLNELGAQGWELVTINDVNSALNGSYFFKRAR